MKALIRTVNLANANYGGVLQNWALQQVLREIGVEPFTDVSVRDARVARSILKSAALHARRKLPSSWHLIPRDSLRHANSAVNKFVADEISTVRLFRPGIHSPKSSLLCQFDAFIVGSDQVWRQVPDDPGSSVLKSFMLDFLPDADPRPKIAYAASFGSNNVNTWDELSIAETASLLKRFAALSVRERAGVQWCRQMLSVQAVQMPDPALLLDHTAYDALIGRYNPALATRPYLFAYILDPEPLLRDTIGDIARQKGLDMVLIGDTAQQGEAVRPSIPAWLATIRGADLVITDSFHGTVFSAIYGRPCAIIPNEARGRDRFNSLVSQLGMNERCLVEKPEVSSERLLEALSLYREPRRDTLASLSSTGRAFLARSLGIATTR